VECLVGDIGTSTKRMPRTTRDAVQAAGAAGNRLHINLPISAPTNEYKEKMDIKYGFSKLF
jgi:hypothetical protein